MKALTVKFGITMLCIAIVTTTVAETGTVFSIKDPDIVKALEALNTYRKNAGLKPVKLNEELSRACFAHSRYVVKNYGKPATAGLSGHYEIDSLPYATPQGKQAGLSSCIAYVNAPDAIVQFMNTFYHRMPLIDPNSTEVGIGYYTENYNTVCCVDMRNKWQYNNDTAIKVVVYPAPDALDITLSFQNERPNPIPDSIGEAGYPITVEFVRQYGIKNVKSKVTDKEGREIKCILSTPEQPLTDFPQSSTVCIIPVNRLQYNQTYTVDFSCTVAGKPFRKKWSFHTRIGWETGER
jgi:hypothetical protein